MDLIHISKTILFSLLFAITTCPSVSEKEDNVIPKKIIEVETPKQNIYPERRDEVLMLRIDSINATLDWRKINCGLYRNKKDELGLQIDYGTSAGSTKYYITDLCCAEQAIPLKSKIDTTTFRYLGSTFYKDKHNIYHYYDMAYGGKFYIYKGVDYKSFKVIGDSYAKDKNHIYGERAGVLENVDYKTFTTVKGVGPYGKDKYGYYFWDDLVCTLKGLDSLALSENDYDNEFYKKMKKYFK